MSFCELCQIEHSSNSCYNPGRILLNVKDAEIASLRAQVAALEERLREAEKALMLIALSKDGKPRDLRPNWRIAEEALGAFPLIHDEFHAVKKGAP